MRRRRLALVAAAVAASALAPAAGAGSAAPTTLRIESPAAAILGEIVVVRARLAGADGTPIARAAIVFATEAEFLNETGEAEVAEAVTGPDGAAQAEWQPRTSGPVSVIATFSGDPTHAPSRATASVTVSGARQLYSELQGVQLLGIDAGPGLSPRSGRTGSWPRLNGWPIGVILMIVWSLFAYVVLLLLRISKEPPWAGAAAEGQASLPAGVLERSGAAAAGVAAGGSEEPGASP